MNIYALKGHKVRLRSNINIDADHFTKKDKEYLKKGENYTVESTEVSRSWSKVKFQEFPNITFNTVHFEDIELQSEEDTQKHPDWLKCHGINLQREFNHLPFNSIIMKLGYNHLEVPSKISSWYIEKSPETIEEEIKRFEELTLQHLEKVRDELNVFVEKCLKKDK